MLSNGGVEVPINREEVRERLRRMTDEQLREYGRACVHMCSPQANLGKPPREAFVVQLEEAKVEYRRRQKKEWRKLMNFGGPPTAL
jgi:hypothetical protein